MGLGLGLGFGQCLVGRHGDAHAELCADAWFEVRLVRRVWLRSGLGLQLGLGLVLG